MNTVSTPCNHFGVPKSDDDNGHAYFSTLLFFSWCVFPLTLLQEKNLEYLKRLAINPVLSCSSSLLFALTRVH